MSTTNTGTPVQRVPDIYLLGTGIMSVWHLTRETEACLRASSQVFLVDPGFGVERHISNLGPKVHNLLNEYKEGTSRLDSYRAMAAKVVAAAMEKPPVSLAVYGHPTLFVYPSELIRQAAKYLGLRVHTAAAVSSLDTMLIDLDIDPGKYGLQIYDANAILVEHRKLDPEVPCLLLQVDSVESAFHIIARSRPSRFARLQEHLMQFYPPDHIVTNIRSSSFPIFGPELYHFQLQQLGREFAEKGLGGTVYFPPARETELDVDLAHEMYDPLHINRISYSPE
jgi:tetrapyrrole methylase family protein/MazG family protein